MDNYQQVVNQQATGDNGNVQNQSGNTGAGTPSGDSNRARNGLWINQLPKALRSSFDGEEMPTIGDLAREYIRLKELKEGTEGNQDNAKPARKHPEESYAEVKKYFAEGDGFDARRDQKLFALLKDSDVDPAQLKVILDEKPGEDDMKSALKKAGDRYRENLKTMWADSFDSNMKILERAMQSMDEATRKEIERSGENFSPLYADLLVQLEKARNPGSNAGSSNGGTHMTDAERMGWVTRK